LYQYVVEENFGNDFFISQSRIRCVMVCVVPLSGRWLASLACSKISWFIIIIIVFSAVFYKQNRSSKIQPKNLNVCCYVVMILNLIHLKN
jgi:hypothetical protein